MLVHPSPHPDQRGNTLWASRWNRARLVVKLCVSTPPPESNSKSKERNRRESIDKSCSTSWNGRATRRREDRGGQDDNTNISRDGVQEGVDSANESASPVPFRIGEARESGGDVDGAGLGENISCSDPREGDWDENGPVSLKGRGSLRVDAICPARRLQKHEWAERPCRVRLSAVVVRHFVANIAEVGLGDGSQGRAQEAKDTPSESERKIAGELCFWLVSCSGASAWLAIPNTQHSETCYVLKTNINTIYFA
ncbi:hypothetical protein EDD16DRAFT_1733426 [Pisolithus croceorrhizus]|nr:hypothetical protein EDD16DRAFT_1733426 [Pisolithus croceorrhizus]KAI6107165.1 hypothetical protein EV401DRAFT_1892182 [Pisolithus croceorrhizus]